MANMDLFFRAAALRGDGDLDLVSRDDSVGSPRVCCRGYWDRLNRGSDTMMRAAFVGIEVARRTPSLIIAGD